MISGEFRQHILQLIPADRDDNEVVAILGVQPLNDMRWRGSLHAARQLAKDKAVVADLL